MPTDLPALLSRLDELHGKATPEPWWPSTDQDECADYTQMRCKVTLRHDRVLFSMNPHFDYADDLAFVAAIRNAYPQLRTELARLRDVERAARDLVPLAEQAMREANRDGAEFDIDAELADIRAAFDRAAGGAT